MINLFFLGAVYFQHFTYLAIFTFLVLNGTGFFPFPEEATMLISGYLLSLKFIEPGILFPTVMLGLLIGDSIYYFIGRRHPHALKRYGRYIFLSRPIIDKFHIFFEKHGTKTIFLSRFILGFRIAASFFAGSRGMKYSTYLLYDLAGAFIWSLILILFGYLFGTYIEYVIFGIKEIRHGFFIIFMIFMLGWMSYHYFKHILNPKRTKI